MSERWKPGNFETYFYVGRDFEAYNAIWLDDFPEKTRWQKANCFRTEAEAQAAAEKVKALLLSLHCDETLQDKQLPNLTAEVFNRPDCPEWAKYAAVTRSGNGIYLSSKPYPDDISGGWHGGQWGFIKDDETRIVKWDASDWKNSLIERPATLPGWCKVGEYGYDYASGYFKIIEIIDNGYNLKVEWIKEKVSGIVFGDNLGHKYPARLRPYNVDEMKALVGKVLEDNHNIHLVIGFIKPDPAENLSCFVRAGQCWSNAEKILASYTIDGKPAGVFEHLENGEWVK